MAGSRKVFQNGQHKSHSGEHVTPRFFVCATAGLALAALAPHARHSTAAAPEVQPNPNTARAGTLRNGVLTVALEAKEAAWQLNGPDRPPRSVAVFAEPGKPPL